MEPSLLQAIQMEPADRSGWLILSDWLEEDGRLDEAAFVRLREELTVNPSDGPARDRQERRLRALLRRGVRPPAALWTGRLNRDVEITFSLVPPGRFRMGSPDDEADRYDNEGPLHMVSITRPFYLGIHPVTQRQWRALMDDEPYAPTDPDRPADSVSGHQAEEFCRRASEALGRAVRLPFDAEWEFACRGGTRSMFYTGDGSAAMRRAGWCSRNDAGSARRSCPVGRYLPNPWGLYDMSGNVREWCADDQRRYTPVAQVDPRGPTSDATRIVRGGSWYYTAEDSRSASRYQRPMDYRLEYYGFRVALPCG